MTCRVTNMTFALWRSSLWLIGVLAMLALARGDAKSAPATATLTCQGPSDPVFPGSSRDGLVTATLRDDNGKALVGKAIKWSASSAPGSLSLPDGGDPERSLTNASGEASITYLMAFDAGWQGDITVTAEAIDAPSLAKCEARFRGISLGDGNRRRVARLTPTSGRPHEGETDRLWTVYAVGGTGMPSRRQMLRTVGSFRVVWRGTGTHCRVAGLLQIV